MINLKTIWHKITIIYWYIAYTHTYAHIIQDEHDWQMYTMGTQTHAHNKQPHEPKQATKVFGRRTMS